MHASTVYETSQHRIGCHRSITITMFASFFAHVFANPYIFPLVPALGPSGMTIRAQWGSAAPSSRVDASVLPSLVSPPRTLGMHMLTKFDCGRTFARAEPHDRIRIRIRSPTASPRASPRPRPRACGYHLDPVRIIHIHVPVGDAASATSMRHMQGHGARRIRTYTCMQACMRICGI